MLKYVYNAFRKYFSVVSDVEKDVGKNLRLNGFNGVCETYLQEYYSKGLIPGQIIKLLQIASSRTYILDVLGVKIAITSDLWKKMKLSYV
ncbi:MAG: hypothetical protein VXY77_01775 [Pseudomonadota bacterium]|nr:hypothetical protein [Pseudomonadota bacterium]